VAYTYQWQRYGILIQGDSLFCFSALPYTFEDLKGLKWGGKHPSDLAKQDFTDLNIDYGQMGVGGDDSWGHGYIRNIPFLQKSILILSHPALFSSERQSGIFIKREIYFSVGIG